jgi:hypothetical protein
LFASNHSTSSKWITCWWYDKSENTEIEIVFQYPLTAKAFLKLDSSYTVLEEGDEIRVQSETGSTCTVICTVELEATSAVQYSQY